MNANPAFAATDAPALDPSGTRAPQTSGTRDRLRDRDRVRESSAVTTLDSFDAYRVSLDACRAVAPIAPTLSAHLKDQILRASSSVVLNIAEGFGSSSRGVKRRHYEIARGSAVECIAVLDLASALGASSAVDTAIVVPRILLTRVAMMLKAGGSVSLLRRSRAQHPARL